DLDTPEQNARAQDYLLDLARSGTAPVYWTRHANGRERGHLELYFDRPVNPEAARQWAISVCPDLTDVEECFPCDGKTNKQKSALSWPLHQSIGGEVYPSNAL